MLPQPILTLAWTVVVLTELTAGLAFLAAVLGAAGAAAFTADSEAGLGAVFFTAFFLEAVVLLVAFLAVEEVFLVAMVM